MLKQRGKQILKVDAVKVAHHGSAGNVSDDLLAMIDSPRFLVSTNGSRFRHVRFLGGGGALLERVEYKGMVDVHWADDVEFHSCEFAGNVRCDDAVNAVHADVDLFSCAFHDTAADAADSTGLGPGGLGERAGDGVEVAGEGASGVRRGPPVDGDRPGG